MMNRNEDLAKLLLRITCAGLLLFHGSFKIYGDFQHIKDMVHAAGLPEFIAYGNFIGELIAPLFVIIGYKTRIAALIIAINMLVSILMAHTDIVFKINDYGAWMIELNVFYMMTAIALFFLGSGKYSLSKGIGKWE
jgi:putative oxidoreductase